MMLELQRVVSLTRTFKTKVYLICVYIYLNGNYRSSASIQR